MKNPSWKIPLYLLMFGILTVVGVLYKDFGQRKYSTQEVLGKSTNLEVFIQPEAGRQPIVEAINNARSEVLVEVYLLSDKEVINALTAAAERGVSVQVMIEKNPFGGGNVNRSTADRLQSTAVQFKWTNPTFALTHEKAIVIDRKTAFILNQNLTQSAFDKNREFDIVDHNKTDVEEVVQIFQADWNRSGYTPVATDLVVSPDNSRGILTAFVKSATSSIDAELEIIQDRDMIDLLGSRLQGSGVRIILPDFKKVPSNEEMAKKLKSMGVQVRTMSSPYVHAKMILVDKTRAYVGSVNLSDASMDQNRELGILVSQSDIIEKLKSTFEEDWEKGMDI